MKKISKWSLVGYVCGVAFAFLSAVRYFVMYPDTDKALVYVIIGGLICCVAWLYNKQLSQGHTLEAVEEYLADRK